MRVYESQTYTPPSWRFSGHPVVDVGGQEYAVNRQTHTIDKEDLNKQLEQQQIAYVNAKARGDKQAMEQAAKNGAELRKNGADLTVSPAAAALQKYYDQSGVKVAISSHSVADLNKGILQAKNDYAWAKANNDQAGMAAAAQMGANLRAMGGTIGSDVSLTDAKKIVYGAPKPSQPTNSSSTQTQNGISKAVSFIGGVIYSVMNNTSNGALHIVANDDSLTGKSYVAGKVVGDIASAVIGVANLAEGVTAASVGAVGGVLTSETVVGGAIGAAVATAGAAQATYGAVTVGSSLSSLYHDTMSLAKSSSEGTGEAPVPTKTGAGSDPTNYVNQHAQKHIYDPSTPSTPSKTQYGKDVDVKKLVEDTKQNPDSVEQKYQDPANGKKGVTIYSKEYDGNISTDDTPTGSHRVMDNHDKPNKSTHFPYVPRQ